MFLASGSFTASSMRIDFGLGRLRVSCPCAAPALRPVGRITRMYGFSEVIGSWKIIAIFSARTLLSSVSRQADQFAALELGAAAWPGRSWRAAP